MIKKKEAIIFILIVFFNNLFLYLFNHNTVYSIIYKSIIWTQGIWLIYKIYLQIKSQYLIKVNNEKT